jgi:hypothetical protein
MAVSLSNNNHTDSAKVRYVGWPQTKKETVHTERESTVPLSDSAKGSWLVPIVPANCRF